MRLTRRQLLRQVALGGIVSAVGALTACDVAAPPPTPRPIPTPTRARPEPAAPPPTPTPESGGIGRVLFEAEDFRPLGPGWQPIAVGRGNGMVDSIGASHISGGALLHARADAVGAQAVSDSNVPKAGPYRLIARYEYPFRDYHVRMGMIVQQPDHVPVRVELGAPGTIRSWF